MKAAAETRSRADSGEGLGLVALWAGLLGPPLVFLSQLALGYALAYWACSTGRRFVLDLVTLGALSLVALCAWSAWRLLAGSRGADPKGGERPDRTRFLALAGLLSSALFALAVLASTVPRAVIGPCAP